MLNCVNYICGNFTFETLNLHVRESTLEKIVPQGLIQNTNVWSHRCCACGGQEPKIDICVMGTSRAWWGDLAGAVQGLCDCFPREQSKSIKICL